MEIDRQRRILFEFFFANCLYLSISFSPLHFNLVVQFVHSAELKSNRQGTVWTRGEMHDTGVEAETLIQKVRRNQ